MRKRAGTKLSPAASEDVIQEVFAKVCRRGRLEEVRDPEGFLSRVLSNEIVAHYRKSSRREICSDSIDSPPPDQAWLGESLGKLEDRDLVRMSLAALKPRQRHALTMFAQGMSHGEIARSLNISGRAVVHLLSRAKANLRRELVKKGFVPGLIPPGWLSSIRRRMNVFGEILARLGHSLEPLVLTFAIVFSGAVGGGLVQPLETAQVNRSWPTKTEIAETINRSSADIPGTHRKESEASMPVPTSSREQLAGVEYGNTTLLVEGQKHNRPEPPPDEQIQEVLRDPHRVLPDCPKTVPCPLP